MAVDKCTEEEYVHGFFKYPLRSMQFVAMETPRDMNGLDAWALHCAIPLVT